MISEKFIKNASIVISFIILIIPTFFGINFKYFFIRELNLYVILFSIFGLFILLLGGKLIGIYCFDGISVEIMRKHEVIDILINKNNKFILWSFFPLHIAIEELVFRYYLIGFLYNQLDLFLAIFISSLVFSLYHIHFWFAFKNLRLLLIFIGYSFLLGLYNGYILLTLGIFPCILIHYIVALYLYYNIYRRYFKTNN